jgi:CheY-like chemotaxis protein
VLAEVTGTLEPMAAHGQITLELGEVAPELPEVTADRTRLCQILMNYGSNAIKYGKPGGRATFEATCGPHSVRLTVTDDGIGIPLDKQPKMFEPFQRAGQETGPIEGTGIGLAISKRLAGLMSGRVGFSSDPGRGSRFWVEVPIHHASVVEPSGVQTPPAVISPLMLPTAHYKIVYVEDNPSNIAFMREFVEDFASIELLTAPTAEIGLPLIRAHLPALVIMDINLPGMSGLDATRHLAAWPETRHIPIVGLSAAALLRDTALAKEVGFYRYLTKPVKVAELAAILEELLTRDPHQP